MSPAPTIEQLLPGFFRVEVPMPENPLKALNVYVARGPERHLLIDNGFNMPSCEATLREALEQLGVDLARTDFFLTHMHSDHCGLTMKLRCSSASKIFLSQSDGARLNESITEGTHWQRFLDVLGSHGFPSEDWESLRTSHPGKQFCCQEPLPFTAVHEGDVLGYGSCRFQVLSVPGHTPGHLALLEENSGGLVAGDHILARITPNITHWEGVDDSLGDYLRSLEKIRALPEGRVTRCFPGHRQLVDDPRLRIDQLFVHHRKRLQEICDILRREGAGAASSDAASLAGASAYAVAARMRWALRGQWNDFRVQQRCFATGETIAHLVHLARTGRAEMRQDASGIYRFAPCASAQGEIPCP